MLNPDSFVDFLQLLYTLQEAAMHDQNHSRDEHDCNFLYHGLVAGYLSFGSSERKLSRKPRFRLSLSLFGILCCKGNSSVARWFGVPLTDHAKSIQIWKGSNILLMGFFRFYSREKVLLFSTQPSSQTVVYYSFETSYRMFTFIEMGFVQR